MHTMRTLPQGDTTDAHANHVTTDTGHILKSEVVDPAAAVHAEREFARVVRALSHKVQPGERAQEVLGQYSYPIHTTWARFKAKHAGSAHLTHTQLRGHNSSQGILVQYI